MFHFLRTDFSSLRPSGFSYRSWILVLSALVVVSFLSTSGFVEAWPWLQPRSVAVTSITSEDSPSDLAQKSDSSSPGSETAAQVPPKQQQQSVPGTSQQQEQPAATASSSPSSSSVADSAASSNSSSTDDPSQTASSATSSTQGLAEDPSWPVLVWRWFGGLFSSTVDTGSAIVNSTATAWQHIPVPLQVTATTFCYTFPTVLAFNHFGLTSAAVGYTVAALPSTPVLITALAISILLPTAHYLMSDRPPLAQVGLDLVLRVAGANTTQSTRGRMIAEYWIADPAVSTVASATAFVLDYIVLAYPIATIICVYLSHDCFKALAYNLFRFKRINTKNESFTFTFFSIIFQLTAFVGSNLLGHSLARTWSIPLAHETYLLPSSLCMALMTTLARFVKRLHFLAINQEGDSSSDVILNRQASDLCEYAALNFHDMGDALGYSKPKSRQDLFVMVDTYVNEIFKDPAPADSLRTKRYAGASVSINGTNPVSGFPGSTLVFTEPTARINSNRPASHEDTMIKVDFTRPSSTTTVSATIPIWHILTFVFPDVPPPAEVAKYCRKFAPKSSESPLRIESATPRNSNKLRSRMRFSTT